MSKDQLSAFVTLMMCCDTAPMSKGEKEILMDFADDESRQQGFNDWLDAYHRLVAPTH